MDRNLAKGVVLDALCCVLSGKKSDELNEKFKHLTCDNIREVISLADQHEVLPLLYDVVKQGEVSEDILQYVEERSKKTAFVSYHLLFLASYVTKLLQDEGIKAIVLKGAVTASYYPVPETRKTTDVDLLIGDSVAYKKACNLLTEHGFQLVKDEHSNHHKSFVSEDGAVVELHSLLVEPFESKTLNEYLSNLVPVFVAHTQINNRWEIEFYELELAYHAYYLLLHMMQHFLGRGFGLRNLCDWVVILQQRFGEQDKQELVRLIRESGMEGFASCLTQICITYLGTKKEDVEFLLIEDKDQSVSEQLLQDIIDGGEFGYAEDGRLVVLRGKKGMDYLREFHHQMNLNYPKSGRIFLLWPILWPLTGARFLYNNRHVRKVSSFKIMQNSKKRSLLFKRLKMKYH